MNAVPTLWTVAGSMHTRAAFHFKTDVLAEKHLFQADA